MQPIAPATGTPFQIESNVQPASRAVVVNAVSTAPRPAPLVALAASEEEVNQAIAAANTALKHVSSDLEFAVDASTGRNVLRVIDATTKQIIRQFPSEELLAITRALDRFQGLLFKEKA